MPAKYLKKVSGDVACPLAYIFYRSFENGYVPSKFKNAFVTPILKKAGLDVDDPSNFRPISNVSLTSKILEHLVWSRLDVYLNRIGTNRQCNRHTVETTRWKQRSLKYHPISSWPQTEVVSLLALLDLSAAFDTVSHGILLHHLHTSHHINGLVLDWFRSYLTSRSESVLYRGDTTSAALIEY